ncbi:hypothetical protein Tco_1329757 [Tanacetum coccineum]
MSLCLRPCSYGLWHRTMSCHLVIGRGALCVENIVVNVLIAVYRHHLVVGLDTLDCKLRDELANLSRARLDSLFAAYRLRRTGQGSVATRHRRHELLASIVRSESGAEIAILNVAKCALDVDFPTTASMAILHERQLFPTSGWSIYSLSFIKMSQWSFILGTEQLLKTQGDDDYERSINWLGCPHDLHVRLLPEPDCFTVSGYWPSTFDSVEHS